MPLAVKIHLFEHIGYQAFAVLYAFEGTHIPEIHKSAEIVVDRLLLRHIAYHIAVFGAEQKNIPAADQNFAVRSFNGIRQKIYQRCFARTVRAEYAVYAVLKAEAYRVKRSNRAVFFC